MSQHDYVIDNASGATVRADINSALSAIQSLNSGTSAPSSTAAGMLWLDTTGGAPYVLKVRDAGNNHWLTLGNVTDPGADGNLELLPGKINLPSSGGIHESDGSTEILTESSGSVTLKNTTIDTTVSFSTRSDFGIIEIFEAGDPLINRNQSQDFSYTAGQRYFVMCNGEFGIDESGFEFYDISTSNSVTVLKSLTALITPSIPSSGTLRITVADNADRLVFAVFLVRMNH
tara:strand:- start:1583 stop:2275 length:693 start_codon:yes stop_codon:yes gene_type:complete